MSKMLLPNTCLSLLTIAPILLARTFPTSQSLHSSVSATSGTVANNTSIITSSQSAQASNASTVVNPAGQNVASKVLEVLGAFEQSPSLQSSISLIPSYTATSDTSLPSSSQSTQSSNESRAPTTAAGRFASMVAGTPDLLQQSVSSNMASTSTKELAGPGATNSNQRIPITITPPASTPSVQSLSINATLSPLPNMATVMIDGTSQVIYKQIFTNLQSITAAENITTPLEQYGSQTTSNGVPLVGAPVAIVVGAGGIWYRIGKTGPPIGPPDLPKLTIGGGVSLYKLFPFFCPKIKSPTPPGSGDPSPNPGNPPKDPPPKDPSPTNPADESEPESGNASQNEKATQSRGEPTSVPTSVPTRMSTSMPSSMSTRMSTSMPSSMSTRGSTSMPSSMSTRISRSMPSSTQALTYFNWVTNSPSGDAVFLSTSDNYTGLAAYFQAQFTSMGIAFDQEDAMAGSGSMDGTNAMATSASSAEKVTDRSATAANGEGAATAAATATATSANLAGVTVLMTTTSSTAGLASTSAVAPVVSTVSIAAEQPAEQPVFIPPDPKPPGHTAPPIFPLACTQSVEVLLGGGNPGYIHTCSCNDGSKPTATRLKSGFACPSQVTIVIAG